MSQGDALAMDVLVEVGQAALRMGDVGSLGDAVLEVLHRRLGLVSGGLQVRDGDGLSLCSSRGMFSPEEASCRVPVLFQGRAVGLLLGSFGAVEASGSLQSLLEAVCALLGAGLATCRQRALEGLSLAEENRSLRRALRASSELAEELLGSSGAMERVRKEVLAARSHRGAVLVRGHAGTGKDLVARLLWRAWCPDGPFVSLGGAGATEAGLRKGAEGAVGGVLYVDGVEELSRKAQAGLSGLLRGQGPDGVRVIGSARCDVEPLVEGGSFEGSLYAALGSRCITLPDLKDRRSDIMLLADHFIESFNVIHNRQIRRLSTPAINLLVAYHWPGNVRELENCMEHAVLTAMGDTVHGYNLPASLQVGGDGVRESGSWVAGDFKTKVASYERELIVGALKRANGKMSGAAQELGISPRVMHYKIRLHGITPAWYRHED